MKSKKARGLCRRRGCCNRTYGRHLDCPKHLKKRERERDPVRASYDQLKWNAKRRHPEFMGEFLSFEQFKEFARMSEYVDNKGQTKRKYAVDRIDPRRGYSLGNIRCISVEENAQKGATIDKRILNAESEEERSELEIYLRSLSPTCPF